MMCTFGEKPELVMLNENKTRNSNSSLRKVDDNSAGVGFIKFLRETDRYVPTIKKSAAWAFFTGASAGTVYLMHKFGATLPDRESAVIGYTSIITLLGFAGSTGFAARQWIDDVKNFWSYRQTGQMVHARGYLRDFREAYVQGKNNPELFR